MLKLKLKPEQPESSGHTPRSGGSPEEPVEPVTSGPVKLNLNLGNGGDNDPGPNSSNSSRPLRIRVKSTKHLVEGYDAEAPDREEDPQIEEAILLRMLPDVPALDALHKACETNDFSGLSIEFVDRRRAVITVGENRFAAQLVDLPTVTEIHKTFDRKNIYKTADLCQMLLVTHALSTSDEPTENSENAKDSDELQYQYPHGIAPPLHNVRNRRFHQRLSNVKIESLEAEVEELFRRDAEATEVHTELLPASAVAAQQALAAAAEAERRQRLEQQRLQDLEDAREVEDEAAAEAEEGGELDDELGLELERALAAESSAAGAGPRTSDPSGGAAAEEDDDDDDEEDDDNENDNEEEEGLSDEQKGARQQNKQLREEIRELEATIEAKERAAHAFINDIMRQRHMDAVNRLKLELEVKRGLLKDAEDEEALEQEESNQAKAAAEAEEQRRAQQADEEDDDEGDEGDEVDEVPMPDAAEDDIDSLF